MNYLKRFLVILVVLVAGLTCRGSAHELLYPTPAPAPATCYRQYTGVFHADPAFSSSEHASITRATDIWAQMSDGQVNTVPQFTSLGDKSPRVYRELSTSQASIDEDVYQTKRHGFPWTDYAWTTDDGDVHLVVDRIPPEALYTITAHEMGHVFKLRWPDCDDDTYDCIHSDDPGAVMFPHYNGAHGFTAGDLAMCRASCLCP